MQVTPIPKQKPFRSKKAIEWFRTQPCDSCGASGDGIVTGHHEPLNGHGIASKGPDDQQIPLCFKCHRQRHDMGRKEYFKNMSWEERVLHYEYEVQIYLGELGIKTGRGYVKL